MFRQWLQNSVQSNGIMTTGVFCSWIYYFAPWTHIINSIMLWLSFKGKDSTYIHIRAMKWFNVFSLSQQTSLHRHHKSLAHYFPRAQYSHLDKLLQDTPFREHAKLWALFFYPLDFPRCGQTYPGHGQVQENSFSRTHVPFVHVIFIFLKKTYMRSELASNTRN